MHSTKASRAILVLAILLAAGSASAQERRGTTAMREKVYDKLSKSQEAAEAGNFDKAFDYLRDVEKMRDLDSHEKAQLYTAFGYTFFAQDNFTEATSSYAKVLEQEEIPEALRTNTLYTLGQLHFHLEHYGEAAGYLEDWLASISDPGPDAHVLLGQAYYELERPEDAAAEIRQAVELAENRGQPVQENWYALLRVLYFELADFDNLLGVLETLVTQYPKKEYWIHIASAYGEMGDPARQLAAYEAAYLQGFLTKGPEIVLLSQLLMQAGVPYRAGIFLEKGLAEGTVEGTARHWRLLSQAWTLSQEHAAAIVALTRAAELSEDGELDARIAQSHANLGQWADSVDAARTALRRGVDNPHEIQVLLGMALFELGRFGEAKTTFAEAQHDPQGRAVATRWLAYVKSEEARLRELGLRSD